MKQYDLENRTYRFALDCRKYLLKLQKNFVTLEDAKQLVRSSGSVAANYIEANESFSRKDYFHRVKICRKEVKESQCWLKLLANVENNKATLRINNLLSKEANELSKIFGAILKKQ